jgi:hypothetical protein
MGTLNILSNSKVLSRVDYTQIEDEITLFLRNKLTDRRNRTLNKTETFIPSNSTIFELTGDLDNKGNHKVMNIRSLSIDGIEKSFYKDYVCGFKLRNNNLTSLNEDIGKIRFWNAPSGSLISVNYDYAYSFVFVDERPSLWMPAVTVDGRVLNDTYLVSASSTLNQAAQPQVELLFNEE